LKLILLSTKKKNENSQEVNRDINYSRMARLLSYKRRDENRYSTFSDVGFAKSTENLTAKVQPKKIKMSACIAPSVHKKPASVDVQKSSISLENIKSRKRMRRWITTTCLPSLRRWVKNILCCCCLRCRRKKEAFEDDDVDRVVEEYCKKQQQLGEGNESQKSTLKSNQSSGGVLWRWDESWKSNSDKFLETLELECVGSDRSLKRAAEKLRAKNSKVRKSTMLNRNLDGGGG
jgi:hypothetical protein